MTLQSVLIVDDDEVDRYLLIRDIRSAGCEATVVQKADGTEAIEFLDDHEAGREAYGDGFPPGVIFVDINMRLMDGFQFLEAFAARREQSPAYRSSVIMMFSSSEWPGERERALAYDFVVDFVVKGETEPADLAARMERASQLASAAAP